MYIKKSNKILVGCLALLLALSVGYALFSETIKINGTATAKGNFDIGITCSILETLGDSNGNCVANNNTITTTSTLTKPGEWVYYDVNITNNGIIPARIKKVTSPNNIDYAWKNAGDCAYLDTSTYLLAEHAGTYFCDSKYTGFILEPGQSENIIITHQWLDASSSFWNATQPVLPNGEASINYDVTFEFEQVTN